MLKNGHKVSKYFLDFLTKLVTFTFCEVQAERNVIRDLLVRIFVTVVTGNSNYWAFIMSEPVKLDDSLSCQFGN